MNDTTDSNTLDASAAAHETAVIANAGAGPDSGDGHPRWPHAALARPSVVAGEQGIVAVAHAAALDWVVATVASAWEKALGRPLSLTGTTHVAAANQSDHSFGVQIGFKEYGISALVSLDSTAMRSLVNPLTSDLAGLMATTSPGPVAETTGTERGIAEYLSLVGVVHVLKHAALNTPGPTIERFLDGAQVEQWLGKHEARSVPLSLNASGSQGFLRVYIEGWSDEQWSPVFAIASQLGQTTAVPDGLDVHLALPSMQMQPEELASLAVGDVVLLGVSELSAFANRCELVTATHWKIADASIVSDSPTYVEASLESCTPVLCDSALNATLIRPLLGESRVDACDRSGRSSIQLTKDASAPVILLVGPTPIARGEMVILGRELAIRIVQMINA